MKEHDSNKMLWALSSFILLSLALVHGADFTGKKLEGNILLPDEVTEIKEGSALKVELADARKQDTSSKTLAHKVIKTPELKYVKGQPIPYSLDLNGEMEVQADYSLSAVLNVGWIPEEGSDEWIRKGDLLTDTNFPVKLDSCSQPEQMICKAKGDLHLVTYN